MSLASALMRNDRDDDLGNRVLLIEHDPAVGRSLQLVLASAGFAVDVTALAEDGVRGASSGGYDLVLLGPNPPGLAGGGDLRASLKLGRIDAAFRFLSVSAAAGDGTTLQINPCP